MNNAVNNIPSVGPKIFHQTKLFSFYLLWGIHPEPVEPRWFLSSPQPFWLADQYLMTSPPQEGELSSFQQVWLPGRTEPTKLFLWKSYRISSRCLWVLFPLNLKQKAPVSISPVLEETRTIRTTCGSPVSPHRFHLGLRTRFITQNSWLWFGVWTSPVPPGWFSF